MKNNVLLLAQYVGAGGIEYMMLNHAIELKRQGTWNPIVFAYESSAATTGVLDHYKKNNIQVYIFNKNKGFSIATVLRILKICFQYRIRVIHSHDIGPLIYAACARFFSLGLIKHVHTQHSFHHLEENTKYLVYEKIFSYIANQLCSVSDAVKEKYVSIGFKRESITCVPNGIALPKNFPTNNEQRARYRDQLLKDGFLLELPPKKYWLLSLGRISESKGQGRIIQAWKKLPSELKDSWALVIVGPEQRSGYISELKNSVSKDDYVIFPGATSDAYSWFCASNLYYSASESEGLPLAPIESLACNLPVFLSNITGHQFLSEFACYFPLNDFEKTAQILSEQMYKIEGSDLIEQSNSSIAKEYGVERMSRAYRIIYDALAKNI